MTIGTRKRISLSADKLSYIDYDGDTAATMSIVLGGTLVATFHKTNGFVDTVKPATFEATVIQAGHSGVAGTLKAFPTTAAKGSLSVTVSDATGDTVTTVNVAAQATTRTYTIPDAGASASFLMTQGAQTVAGLTTFSAGIPAPGGNFTAAPRLCHTGGTAAQVSTDFTDQTPVATEVYIAELFIPANCTITGLAGMNGSVASGNLKYGLADASGAVVATSVSTAMSGTDAYQRIAFTAPYAAKGPATYYALLFVDNTTARLNTHTIGNFGASKQTGQVFATGFTTVTPPTTFTTALGPVMTAY